MPRYGAGAEWITSLHDSASGTVDGGEEIARGVVVVEGAVAPYLVPLEQDSAIVTATDTANAGR